MGRHMRTFAAALLGALAIPAGGQGLLWSQAAAANGDVTGAPSFPPRASYRNPSAVVRNYDQFMDRTTLRLGIASGNPLTLIVKPIVQLELAATFNGQTPQAAPESITVTTRVFRLRVSNQQQGTAPAMQPAQPALSVQQGAPGAATVPGTPGAPEPAATPMLSLLVGDPAHATGAAAPWRTSVNALTLGSTELVTVDDLGISFRGQRWLTTVVNLIDLGRKKGEVPLRLLARSDTGRFSLAALPPRVQQSLHGGLRITITEEVHRLTIPVATLLRMASATDGVKARFGAVEFAIEGDELDALRDFASRLAPAGPGP